MTSKNNVKDIAEKFENRINSFCDDKKKCTSNKRSSQQRHEQLKNYGKCSNLTENIKQKNQTSQRLHNVVPSIKILNETEQSKTSPKTIFDTPHDSHMKTAMPIKSKSTEVICNDDSCKYNEFFKNLLSTSKIEDMSNARLVSNKITIENLKCAAEQQHKFGPSIKTTPRKVPVNARNQTRTFANSNVAGKVLDNDANSHESTNISDLIKKFNNCNPNGKLIVEIMQNRDELSTVSEQSRNRLTKVVFENSYSVSEGTGDVEETPKKIVNVRKETYYDKHFNARIERVRTSQPGSTSQTTDTSPVVQNRSPSPTPGVSEQRIIQELLETELTHITCLAHIIENYCLAIEEDENFKNLFNIITQIFNESIQFRDDLMKCHFNVQQISKSFLRQDHLLNLYVNYIRNKPKCTITMDEVATKIKAKEREMNDTNGLDGLLLTPIQRLPRYIILLENVAKSLKKNKQHCKFLDDAIKKLKHTTSNANTMIAIDSIEKCPLELHKQGMFLLQDDFNVRGKYKAQVFLFEKVVVFTTEVNPTTFFYKDCISMEDLHMKSLQEEIQLRNFTKCRYKSRSEYIFVIEGSPTRIKRWTSCIETLLWKQLIREKEQCMSTNSNTSTL